MAQALYRKYRPQIFEDVVGQEQIERTIKNAIEQDKVSHAYLFCGPRGTGKTTTARLLAKALLCESGPTPSPCGKCKSCQNIASGTHPDVYELDAASRTGVENVREEIINRVQFAPTQGRFKVYIIDEVHMLTTQAFNALLKTLEEPPAHVVFILATTDPQKVPETIHSRCQRFDFRGISSDAIVSRLGAVCTAEGVEFEGDALALIAHYAKGGMRNALTSLEQAITFGEGKVTLDVATSLLGSVSSSDTSKVVRALGACDVVKCFKVIAELAEAGQDLAAFTSELAAHIRNLYVMSFAGSDVALDVSSSALKQLQSELPAFGHDKLSYMLEVLGQAVTDMKTSTNPRLTLEIACTRMVRPQGNITLGALAARIEQLERSLASGSASSIPQVPNQVQPQQISQPVMQTQAQQPVQQQMQMQVPAPAQQATPTQPRVQTPAPAAPVQAATSTPTHTTVPAPQQPPQATAPVPQQVQKAAQRNNNAQLASNVALQRKWQSAIAIIKRNNIAHGALFMSSTATYDKPSNTVTISFPHGGGFMAETLQKPSVVQEAANALSQACDGRKFNVEFNIGSKPSAPQSQIQPQPNAVYNPQSQPVQLQQASTPMQPSSLSSATQPSNSQQQVNASEPMQNANAQAQVGAMYSCIDDVPPWEEIPEYLCEPQLGGAAQQQSAFSSQQQGSEGVQTLEQAQEILQAEFGSGVTFKEVSD